MKDYKIYKHRTEKIHDKILLINDYGEYEWLTEIEYDNLINKKINEETYSKYELKGIIITDKNLNLIQEHYRLKKNFLFHGTSLHIIVPTLRCNQDCIYCHASKKNVDDQNYDMNEETAKKTVDIIFQSPAQSITIEFQGGEPLLNFEIVKIIINYAKEKNEVVKKSIKFALVTNLQLMNEEKLNYLIENDVDICTSLDGPEELHNKNRPHSSHKLVVYWIKKIQEEYKIKKIHNHNVNALLTVTKYSLPLWKEIIDEYMKLNLKLIHVRFLNYLGNAQETWKNISYTAEEFIDFWKKSTEYILLNSEKIEERTWNLINVKANTEYDPNFLDWRSPCGAAIGQLVYDYNGSVYTCDEGRMIGEDIFKIGDVYKNTYKDLTTCDETCAIIASSINDTNSYCDICAYKPYCGLCPVCNYGEQGNIIAKIPETTRCKIFKAQFKYFFEHQFKNKILDN